jgi:hypothetical protein
VVQQLTTVTRPYLAAMYVALVNAVESVVALTVATTALVAVMDAVQVLFCVRDVSVSTFMIRVVLSLQMRVLNFRQCRQ